MASQRVRALQADMARIATERTLRASALMRKAIDGAHGIDGALYVAQPFGLSDDDTATALSIASGLDEFECILKLCDWRNRFAKTAGGRGG